MHIIYDSDAQRLEQDREAYRRYVTQQYVLFVMIPLFSMLMGYFVWSILHVIGWL